MTILNRDEEHGLPRLLDSAHRERSEEPDHKAKPHTSTVGGKHVERAEAVGPRVPDDPYRERHSDIDEKARPQLK